MVGPEKVLVEAWCQQASTHTVGAIKFGPDGALYASAGEGASGGFADYGQYGNPCGDPPVPAGTAQTLPGTQGGALRSQDLRTSGDPAGLSGAIIRVDPATGDALPTNPMASSADPNVRRIIAYGLRNPYRFTLRPGTNELWIADVGWDTYEEINRLPNPTDATVENFGWPCYEGPGRQPTWDSFNATLCEGLYAQSGAVTPPFFTYRKDAQVVPGESCAIGQRGRHGHGVPVLRRWPLPGRSTTGRCSSPTTCGTASGRSSAAAGRCRARRASRPSWRGRADRWTCSWGPTAISSTSTTRAGRSGASRTRAGNQPPVPKATVSPSRGEPPLTVIFDARDSSDPNAGDTLNYVWDLDGDGAYDDSTSVTPSFTYSTPGRHTARVLVGDNHGAFALDSVDVSVGAPTVRITSPSASAMWAARDTISFAGSATDAQDGALPASALSWKTVLHHCQADCHEHFLQSFDGVAGGSFPAPDHDYPGVPRDLGDGDRLRRPAIDRQPAAEPPDGAAHAPVDAERGPARRERDDRDDPLQPNGRSSAPP